MKMRTALLIIVILGLTGRLSAVEFCSELIGTNSENRIFPTPNDPNTTLAATNKLYINEFMASNGTSKSDEYGEFDDWFEIYNDNETEVDLSGYYLTDNLSNPAKWKIPSGVKITGKSFLLFWADGQTDQGNMHTSFKLSASGEELGIFDTDGTTLIDSVTFGTQQSNISFGRNGDGAEDWIYYTISSPGATNKKSFTPVPLMINELMASNTNTIKDDQGDYDDWIELYNNSDESINIGGYFLSDDKDVPDMWEIPAYTMQPRSHLLIWADDDGGTFHANFKLSKTGEKVYIFAPDASTVVDVTDFSEMPDDKSWGRNGDGNSSWIVYESPTPNAENQFINSVESIYNISDIRNYPDPCTDFFTIEFNSDFLMNGEISIYNSYGTKEISNNINIHYGRNSAIIDCRLLPVGAYFYNILSEKGVSVRGKFIIIR